MKTRRSEQEEVYGAEEAENKAKRRQKMKPMAKKVLKPKHVKMRHHEDEEDFDWRKAVSRVDEEATQEFQEELDKWNFLEDDMEALVAIMDEDGGLGR